MSRRSLSRRALLRGAGVALALPWLEAMLPRHARGAPPTAPLRFIGFSIPNGVVMPQWEPAPTDVGTTYALPPLLQPLAAVRGDFSVLTNLANPPAFVATAGSHAMGTSCYLTYHRPKQTFGSDIMSGISVDQILANAWQGQTRFPSLELSVRDNQLVTPDIGWSSIYNLHTSWAGPTKPMPPIVTARAAFDRLFNVGASGKARIPRKSVLDYVLNSANQLNSKLGKVDQRKLDEYLTSVRGIEVSVTNVPSAGSDQAYPANQFDLAGQTKAMMDIIALAFQTDSTRVITYMHGYGGAGLIYDFLSDGSGKPIQDTHHTLSHRTDSDSIAKLAVINQWELQQFSYLLQKLKSTADATGSLLDNVAIMLSSDVGDGATHTHNNLPVLLAGHAGGALSVGQHVHYASNPPLENLAATVMQALGVPQTTIDGRPTALLPGVLA